MVMCSFSFWNFSISCSVHYWVNHWIVQLSQFVWPVFSLILWITVFYILFFKDLFICIYLFSFCWVFFCCVCGLSPFAVSRVPLSSCSGLVPHRLPGMEAPAVPAWGLSNNGLWALEHSLSNHGAQLQPTPRPGGSSRTRDQICVPCIGR